MYDINNNQLTGAAFIGTVGLDWQFAGIGPVHGAGQSDLVLRTLLGHFFQDCLPMKSIRLTKMDLRDLNASSADFEDGFFSCSNFDRTKLIRTKLRNARLKWASLRHADLTKADLTGACLFRADVAGAKFSDDVDRNMLKEACILKQDGQQQRTELETTSQSLAEFSKQIPNCDGPYRCQNDLWDCLSPD